MGRIERAWLNAWRRAEGTASRALLLVMTGALLASAAAPDAEARQFRFFQIGSGQTTCGEYAASYQGMSPATRKVMQKERVFVSQNYAYDEWIFGFLSAMNYSSAMYGSNHPDIRIDNVALIGAVHDYCVAHPDESIRRSVEHFVKSRWAGSNAAGAAAAPPPSTQPPADTTGTLVVVDFQPNVTMTDLQAFLQAYSVTIVEGPDASGISKLRLSTTLSSDQLRLVLDSMKSQERIVKSATAG